MVSAIATSADVPDPFNGAKCEPIWDAIVENYDHPICPMCGEVKTEHDPMKSGQQCLKCGCLFHSERELHIVYRCRSTHGARQNKALSN